MRFALCLAASSWPPLRAPLPTPPAGRLEGGIQIPERPLRLVVDLDTGCACGEAKQA